MQNRGRLLLTDSSTRRLQPLMANLFSAGVMNAVLLNLPGQLIGRHFPEQFDRVLVDAPCSALANLPVRAYQSYWSEAFLRKISTIQEQLLISGIKAARVGGVIVYSTCSICPEENEMVLERILRRYPVELEPVAFAGAPCCRPPLESYLGRRFDPAIRQAVRIHPWPLPFEGFFVARLRKTGPLPIRPVTEAMPWLQSRRGDDPEIAPLLDHLEQLWGIPAGPLRDLRYLRSLHRLWMIAPEWERLPQRAFMMAGLPLADEKTTFWRPTTSCHCSAVTVASASRNFSVCPRLAFCISTSLPRVEVASTAAFLSSLTSSSVVTVSNKTTGETARFGSPGCRLSNATIRNPLSMSASPKAPLQSP
ncbi:MAG: Ribosomal RNA small subunit methyltransferase F [bacterium ADurb.Bin431]|nr:MAG: Ribosomal RNA small subunit methyltransferase F [bacterium ADurb.Bin431]